jgi:tetratricopeptide (TPR) repeat protein
LEANSQSYKARPTDPSITSSDFDEIYQKWLTEPTVSNAAEAVFTARISGVSYKAFGPAEFLIKHENFATPEVVSLARNIRFPKVSTALASPSDLASTYKYTSHEITRLRDRIRFDDKDVFAWLDLSRAFAVLGDEQKSIRHMRTAVGLAPQNRIVLRSAARMYVHFGENDLALALLRNAELVRYDPWLLAAEISVSDLSKRTPRYIKDAEARVTDFIGAPSFITELASSLGTWNLFHGTRKKAKMYLQLSLKAPNDNAFAQGNWISETYRKFPIQNQIPSLETKVFEAVALNSFNKGDWASALSATEGWQKEEPFAARPALLGSFVAATVTNDLQRALNFVELGHRANPTDQSVLNNFVYCLVLLHRFDEAKRHIASFRITSEPSEQNSMLWATKSLYEFMTGNIEEGRRQFEHAVFIAKEVNKSKTDTYFEVITQLHFVKAELSTPQPNYSFIEQKLDSIIPIVRKISSAFVSTSAVVHGILLQLNDMSEDPRLPLNLSRTLITSKLEAIQETLRKHAKFSAEADTI